MYLETQRLILRNLKPSDESEYLLYRNSEFVLRYNAMEQQTAQQAAEYIQGNLTNNHHVAIARKDTGAFVGMIFVEEDSLRYRANSLEVAYWLGQPHSCQGFMTEALGALVHHLFTQEGVSSHHIQSLCGQPQFRQAAAPPELSAGGAPSPGRPGL